MAVIELLLLYDLPPLNNLAVHSPPLTHLVVVVQRTSPQPLLLQTQTPGLGSPLRGVLGAAEVKPLAQPCE